MGSGSFTTLDLLNTSDRSGFAGMASPDKKYNTFGGRLKSSLFKGSLRRNSILKQFLVTFGLNDSNTSAAGGGSGGGNTSPTSSSSSSSHTPYRPNANANANANANSSNRNTPASTGPHRGQQSSTASSQSQQQPSRGKSTSNTDLSQIDKLSDSALDDMQRLMMQNTSKGKSALAKLEANQRELQEKRRSIMANAKGGISGGKAGGSVHSTGRISGAGTMSSRQQHLFGARSVFRTHLGPIRTLHACSDGRRIVTGGDDGLVKLWAPANANANANANSSDNNNSHIYKCSKVLRGATGPVFATAYLPAARNGSGLVLGAGRDSVVNVWHVGPDDNSNNANASSKSAFDKWSPFTSTQIHAHTDAVWGIIPRPHGGGGGQVLFVGADGFVSFVDIHNFLSHPPTRASAGSSSSSSSSGNSNSNTNTTSNISSKNGLLHRFAFESQVDASTPNPTAAAFLEEGNSTKSCVVAFDVSTLIQFDLETGRRVATLNPDAAMPVDLHPCVRFGTD